MTTFGTSAAYIASCMKAGVEPRDGRDLGALRAVGSTGSPLSPEGFDWVYEHVGSDTWLFSTSGGTDVCTAFVGGVPTLPVYQGELQARALGAKVESFDEDGNALVGQVGELVLTEPMPSMPICFWGDDDGSRLRESYFDDVPGRLAPRRLDRDHRARHGDHLRPLGLDDQPRRDPDGHERDLPRGAGRRRGRRRARGRRPARGRRTDWMPLFVVLREGATLDDDLVGRIKQRIREDCSPRHVPNEIHAIAEVPRTLSGKVLEVPVKRILMGEPPEQGRQPRVAGQPGRPGLLRRAGRRRLTQPGVDARDDRRGELAQLAARAPPSASAGRSPGRQARARAARGTPVSAAISASVGCALLHQARGAGSSHSRTVRLGRRGARRAGGRAARARRRRRRRPRPTARPWRWPRAASRRGRVGLGRGGDDGVERGPRRPPAPPPPGRAERRRAACRPRRPRGPRRARR